MELEGRVALVTGGGRGLGRATALSLAERGARVVVVSRSLEQVEQTAVEIRRQFGVGRALAIRADVTHERDVVEAFELVRKRWGAVDILVNNAGSIGPTRLISALSLSEWENVVNANLTSAFICSREALHDMTRRRWGRIVNVSSDSASAAVPGISAYSVAKAAIEHLTRIIAAEYGAAGVVAVALRPGVIDTRMQEEMRSRPPDAITPELRAAFSAYKQKGLLVPPEVPARMIAYLCTAHGSDINGSVFDAREIEELATRQ